MHVFVAFTWPDESSVDVHLDDDGLEYNPIRTAEMVGYARDLLRNVLADREHTDAEHKAE